MPTWMAWSWRLQQGLVVIRPASDGSLGSRWAATSGLPRVESASSVHEAQRHPGCRWQRGLGQSVCNGRRGSGGLCLAPIGAHDSWAAAADPAPGGSGSSRLPVARGWPRWALCSPGPRSVTHAAELSHTRKGHVIGDCVGGLCGGTVVVRQPVAPHTTVASALLASPSSIPVRLAQSAT